MRVVKSLPRIPRRDPDAHKGSFGSVLVAGGSRDMSGAVVLAGQSALRSGAGLVFIAVPASVQQSVAARTTCCLTRGLPETEEGALDAAGFAPLMESIRAADAAAIGPGMGRHPATAALARRVVREASVASVVDADGLNAVAEDPSVLKEAQAPRVLTPHPGEMARLCGLEGAKDVQANREAVAAGFAREHGCVVLLKGRGTIVTDGRKRFVNATGNPGMATGGSGDVLTGIVAALLAQGFGPFEAAALGAHAHGLAGDLAAERVGQTSLIASDILDALPEAFKRLSE